MLFLELLTTCSTWLHTWNFHLTRCLHNNNGKSYLVYDQVVIYLRFQYVVPLRSQPLKRSLLLCFWQLKAQTATRSVTGGYSYPVIKSVALFQVAFAARKSPWNISKVWTMKRNLKSNILLGMKNKRLKSFRKIENKDFWGWKIGRVWSKWSPTIRTMASRIHKTCLSRTQNRNKQTGLFKVVTAVSLSYGIYLKKPSSEKNRNTFLHQVSIQLSTTTRVKTPTTLASLVLIPIYICTVLIHLSGCNLAVS